MAPGSKKKASTKKKTVREPKNKVRLFDAKPVSTFKLQPKAGYVISSALNNLIANDDVLDILLNYCEYNDYQLIIGAERYQNPTSKRNYDKLESEYWWDSRLAPYLVDERLDLFDDGNVIISGHIRERATVRKPLNLFDSVADGVLQVLPFGKLHLVPCMRHASEEHPSFLATTGSVTDGVYSHTAVGSRANAEHEHGAIVVERRDDGFFNFRHLEILDSELFDLDLRVTPDTVEEGQFTRLIYGFDLHAASCPESSVSAITDLIEFTGCPELVIGDLVDWELSHHKTPLQFATQDAKNPLDEFETLIGILQSLPEDLTITVPHSNHHDHVEIWLNACMHRGCGNTTLWPLVAKLASLKFEHPKQPVLRTWWESHPDLREINWLDVSESYVVDGVENGQHGHVGLKGSRGSVDAFAKTRQVINIGHVHAACRLNGVMSSGVSGPMSSHEYANKGYGDWSISAIIQYINGARSHVHCFNGSFV
jgi:hypothetical protein